MGQFWPPPPRREDEGEELFPPIANGANATITVNFPAGTFTAPPLVTFNCNVLAYTFLGAATESSVVLGLANRSGAAIPNARVQWMARQPR